MKGKFRIIVYLIFILSFLFNPFSAICKEASPPHYEICAVKYGDSYRVEKDPTESGEDKRIPFAWIFWVIRRANKIILVDTGFNNETLKEKWQISNFRQMDTLLEKLGIEPANITDIIITHSHWDHIGNLAAFPGADIWMQKKEYDFARSTVSDSRPHYKGVRLEDVKELVEAEKEGRLHLIKGDKEIFPGISVYLAGGHTPGIQFVSLETKTGRIILASDTFYLYKDMPLQTQTGYTKTSPKSNRLFKRMEKIAVSPERIIPGHDPAVFKRFKSITEGIVDMTSPLSANEIDESQSGIDFIKFPDSIKVGKEYEIIMHLVNEGPSSSGAKGAFCGLHVEVENAAVKNVLGYSAFTKARETRVMKAGNIRWFETIYNRLKEGDKGAVRFHIIPKKLPVKFYYRGWIPTSVPEEKKAEAIRDLKDRFKADGTWRHEKYIKRIPASDDASAPLCKIIVRAGHEKKQYYRCLFKEIPDSGTIPKTVTVKEAGDRIKATIKELRKLSPEEKRLLLGIARQTLKKTAEGEQMPRPADVPEGLAGYDNTVFVTVYKNGRIKGCMGSGRGDLMDATISASTSILSDKRFDVNLVRNPEQLEQLLIGINILARKEKVKSRSLKGIKGEVSLGIHGVEVKQGKRRALYKDSVAITSRMKHERLLESLSKKAGLDKDVWKKESTDIYKFETLHFIEAKNKKGYLDLIRATTYLPLSDITRKTCTEAILNGADWLARSQRWDGGYAYLYYPSKNAYSTSDNIIRQAGTAYSMAFAGRIYKKRIFTSSAKRAIDYVLRSLRYLDENKKIPYLYGGKSGTLGGNALLLLAMVELEGNSRYRNIMKKLVDSILYMQNEDGFFNTYYEPKDKTGGQDFYPGEALFALARYYKRVNKDPRCIDALSRAFTHYSNYWREDKKSGFIPWQSQAWSVAYNVTGDKKYVKFVWEMNDWLLDVRKSQFTQKNPPFPDCSGGFGRTKLPQFDTSCYIESLADAFRLARVLRDNERLLKYGKALARGARFILNLQFTDENMYYIKNASRTEGGFRLSLTDNALRCDATQHAIIALSKLLEYFRDEDFDRFFKNVR